MTTFGPGGRDLTGWKVLRDLNESIYAKDELAQLDGRILFETQMPFSSSDMGSPIDLRAGTCIQWNLHEDMLDHHWEMRRMDRISPAWRALMPCEMDSTGHSDADCWIEMERDRMVGIVHRDEGEDTESTLRIIHARADDGTWSASLEVTFVHDGPDSEALALFGDQEAMAERLRQLGWCDGGRRGLLPELVEDQITIRMPLECLTGIDGARRKSLD